MNRHPPELFPSDEFDGENSQLRRQNPVKGGRRPAALDMSEDRDPHLGIGTFSELACEKFADASEFDISVLIAAKGGLQNLFSLFPSQLSKFDS